MQIGLPAFRIAALVASLGFAVPAVVASSPAKSAVDVSSLDEFVETLTRDNVAVRLKPGTYTLHKPLEIKAANSTYDLTGVTID